MRWRPNMIAILVEKELNMIAMTNPRRTIYDCNLGNRARDTWSWLLVKSRKNKISIIAIISSPYLKGLQSYLVRSKLLIAIIYGPYHEKYCNHKCCNPLLYIGVVRESILSMQVYILNLRITSYGPYNMGHMWCFLLFAKKILFTLKWKTTYTKIIIRYRKNTPKKYLRDLDFFKWFEL